jgi:hypothetical protein
MLIAVPSKGRAGETTTDKFLSSATFYVPENELADYRKAMKNPIVVVPKEVRGITPTRNWILDNTKERWVQFLDDDVARLGWIELLSHSAKYRDLGEDEWVRETRRLFEITEGVKLRLWGVSTDAATRSVYPYKPFIWHTYITASCMGILNNGLRFDESFPVKEDYEICLRCIRDDGGVLGARYFFCQSEHWDKAGGCKDYRTQDMEETAINRLLKMYPKLIRRVTRGGSHYSVDVQF